MAITKATFGLPEEAMTYLKEESGRRGISMADVLRQAISTDKFLKEATDEGANILIDRKGKKTTQLVIAR
jgi:hypothetical protein